MFKSIKKRLKDQRGLTLVELLAVIVILGIIAGIAVPNIGTIIEKTEKDAKVAEGIQIIQAAKLYTAQKNPASGTALTYTSHLDDYLDNVKDQGFTVTVTKDSSGKYTYSLTDHNSVGLVDKDASTASGYKAASESELLEYK